MAPRAAVLIVEDDRIIALDVRRSLEDLGYGVVATARTAEEALSSAVKHRPDLVLMDVNLNGGGDGIVAGALVRAATPRSALVYLTGSSDDATLQRALATRPEGYLIKPFTTRGLRSTIEVALHKSGTEQRLRDTSDELAGRTNDLQDRDLELTLLAQLGDLLGLAEYEAEVWRVVDRLARRLLPCEQGAVYLLEKDKLTLEAIVAWGDRPLVASFPANACRAVQGGGSHRSLGPSDLACPHVQDLAGSGLCLPMVANGETIGVMCLHASDGGIAAREPLATTVVQRIVMTIGHLQVKARLEREAMVDALTGLSNRRHMEVTLNAQLRMAVRKGHPLGFILIDLDGFKAFNTDFGHAAGDAVLRAVGAYLRSRIRVYDIACRYGGEEILLILPDTDSAGAQILAEEVRIGIRALSVPCGSVVLPPVTASLGVSSYPADGADVDTLLRGADAALYRAKADGRDRVVLAPGGTKV